MNIKDIILGIDLGGTIHHKNEKKETVPMDNAFRVINHLRNKVKAIYIVSRVNDEQSLRAYQWFQKFKFFEETGLTPNKVFFCYERYEKGPICNKLRVTHFIDDRPEVMFYMPAGVNCILMNPKETEVKSYGSIERGDLIAKSWNDIETYFQSYE